MDRNPVRHFASADKCMLHWQNLPSHSSPVDVVAAAVAVAAQIFRVPVLVDFFRQSGVTFAKLQ